MFNFLKYWIFLRRGYASKNSPASSFSVVMHQLAAAGHSCVPRASGEKGTRSGEEKKEKKDGHG